ncbi:MAG: TIGR04282 family arsenosugar biosynthesis glycosyltransferase, partial [Chitinophagaceae bacterium]
MKTALIIFVKNLRYGQVKTRIAAKLGHEEALTAYKILLQHTREISRTIHAENFLFYSETIENDEWPGIVERQVQQGNDLGTRMQNAFDCLFSKGYEKGQIIGSDCLELTSWIIAQGV